MDFHDKLFGGDEDEDAESEEYCYSSGSEIEIESEQFKPRPKESVKEMRNNNWKSQNASMKKIMECGFNCGGFRYGEPYSIGCGMQIRKKGYNYGREFNVCTTCGEECDGFESMLWITPFIMPDEKGKDAQPQTKAELKQPLKHERAMEMKQPLKEAEVVSAIPQKSLGKEKCQKQQKEKEEPMSKNRRKEGRRKNRASTATGELNLGVKVRTDGGEMTGGDVTRQNREKTIDHGSGYKMDSVFALSDENATHISDTIPERGLKVPTSLTVEGGDSVFREKSSYVNTDYLEVCELAVLQPLNPNPNPRRVDASFETCLTFLMEVLSKFVFAHGAKKID